MFKLTLLNFEGVNYINNDKVILKDFTVEVNSGDFISIIGSSGSGKSTFMKLCCHLISPSSGMIYFNEKDLLQYDPTELRQRIAYCFQTPHLFGTTIKDNMEFPFMIRNQKVNHQRVSELFKRFNMDGDWIHKEIKNLSGGEKQRVALIRTLLFRPEILLLDEVTSALDLDNTAIVEKVIKSLNEEGLTILWITHNPKQNQSNANKRLTIENGEIKSLEVLK